MHGQERNGLIFALAGFALLSTGDAVVKSMAGAWSPLAVAALRFVIGAVALGALVAWHEGPGALRLRNPRLQFARGASLAFASLLFFSAIFVMPLADAMAVAFVAPVITALLSGPLLGERVRLAVWLLTPVALLGVAVVLRPNLAELGWAALLPLGSAFFFSLVVITNRASAGQASALAMQFYMAAVAAPILVLAALFGKASGHPALAFGWPDWTVIARCTLVAATASTAHWLAYHGTMRAGAAMVAPMTYVQLLVAVALGWWWFGDRPDLVTLGGAAIIIGAGLALWRATATPAGDQKLNATAQSLQGERSRDATPKG